MTTTFSRSITRGQAVTPESWEVIERLSGEGDIKPGRFMETLLLGMTEAQILKALTLGSKVLLDKKNEYHESKRKIQERLAKLTPDQLEKLLSQVKK